MDVNKKEVVIVKIKNKKKCGGRVNVNGDLWM